MAEEITEVTRKFLPVAYGSGESSKAAFDSALSADKMEIEKSRVEVLQARSSSFAALRMTNQLQTAVVRKLFGRLPAQWCWSHSPCNRNRLALATVSVEQRDRDPSTPRLRRSAQDDIFCCIALLGNAALASAKQKRQARRLPLHHRVHPDTLKPCH